ncbi:phosphatidylglycerol/phosphatidylinositol transfer protein [Ceratobasidium sp. AG-Ba]|nr:phosphatidylglycerol/phosphatidylinositol transfer protein [Ceratobasidium sp. AG-Ba]QRV98584.1 phosphatidylglycerol/phosphatidylinositol transfer protein [Ceratobasidium sp. AG-Ba]
MLISGSRLLPVALTLGYLAQAAAVPLLGNLADQIRIGGGDAHTSNSWRWFDLGRPDDAVQVISINVTPDPPQIGKDLTVRARGLVTRRIEEGAYADVTVKLGLIKILHKQFDICEEARNNNVTVQCPVEPGEYEVVQTVTLPKETPKAKFTIEVKGFTSDYAEDADMVNLKMLVDFIGRPWLSI